MYHLLPCLLVCDSRVSSTLFSTASRHINKSYNYRSGFSARREWGEMLSTQHRHQFVLLCVFPAPVRFCVSLVSLAATILGAIHAYQQMIDHRKWEAAYAFWKDLGWPRSGPGVPLRASSSAPGTHMSTAPSLVNTDYQLPHQLSTFTLPLLYQNHTLALFGLQSRSAGLNT